MKADIAMNFEASAAVGAVTCSQGGVPINASHIEYWKAQTTKARQQSAGLAAKVIEMQAEITKLRAERDAAARDVDRLTMERDGWKAEHATLLNDVTEHMQGHTVMATERLASKNCDACDGTGDFQGGRRTLQKPPCSRCSGTGLAMASQPRETP